LNLKQFERYFAANDVGKGGSFYLQSKIYRANELLMEFQAEKRQEEQGQGKQQETKSKS
jgi:import inner membrane translocase subunit TIM16